MSEEAERTAKKPRTDDGPTSTSTSSTGSNAPISSLFGSGSGVGGGGKTFADMLSKKEETSTLGAAFGAKSAVFGSAFANPTFANLSTAAASSATAAGGLGSPMVTTSVSAASPAAASPATAVAATVPATTFGSGSSLPSFGSLGTTGGLLFGKPVATPAAATDDAAAAVTGGAAVSTDAAAAETAETDIMFGRSAGKTTSLVEQVPVVTGEENETTITQLKAKLFQLDEKNIWRERGVGTLKLNVDGETGAARLVMRADGSLRLVLNVRLFNGISCEIVGERTLRVITFDTSKAATTYLIKVRNVDDLLKLKEEISDRFELLPPMGVVVAPRPPKGQQTETSATAAAEDKKNDDNSGDEAADDDEDDEDKA